VPDIGRPERRLECLLGCDLSLHSARGGAFRGACAAPRDTASVGSAEEAWSELSPYWQAAFGEAWDSWCAGCFGIGAVAVKDDQIVATGRNRVLEARTVPGVLADTFTAHAEMNVLGQISWGQQGITLFTTLEPCLMCTSAIVMCRVDEVHHAAADPLMTELRSNLRKEPFVSERWPRSKGPAEGPVAAMARLLPHTFLLSVLGESSLSIQQCAEDDLVRAQRALTQGDLDRVRRDGGSIIDAFSAAWELLGD